MGKTDEDAYRRYNLSVCTKYCKNFFPILRFDWRKIEEGALSSTMSEVTACTVTFWQIIPFMGLTNFSDLKALMCSQNIWAFQHSLNSYLKNG